MELAEIETNSMVLEDKYPPRFNNGCNGGTLGEADETKEWGANHGYYPQTLVPGTITEELFTT